MGFNSGFKGLMSFIIRETKTPVSRISLSCRS